MINKKVLLKIALVFFIFNMFYFISYTSHADADKTETITEQVDSTSWITDAFSATRNFFSDEVTDDLGFVEPWMVVFSDIVRAINRVLIILLAGLSIISLTIVGIKYIMSPYQAARKEEAKQSLHTVFKGMGYGFGAFAIWKIVMSIVKVVIESF